MKVYVVKCHWRYDDAVEIIGIADADHVDALIKDHKEVFNAVQKAILHYDIEEYNLNQRC